MDVMSASGVPPHDRRPDAPEGPWYDPTGGTPAAHHGFAPPGQRPGWEVAEPEPTLVMPAHLLAEEQASGPGWLPPVGAPEDGPYAGQVLWEHPVADPYAGLRIPRDPRDPWDGIPLTPAQRFWVPASHWLGLLTTWIGPVLVLLTVAERDPRVRAHARASLNFEITVTLALLVGAATLPWGVGAVIMGLTGVIWFLARIVAAARAARGRLVRYPGSLRLVR